MKLITKYTIFISSFGIIFILAAFLILSRQINLNMEKETINYTEQTLDLISINIEEIIEQEIDMALFVSKRSNIIDLLKENNQTYAGYSQEERALILNNRNDEWMKSNTDDELVSEILNNKLSELINSIKESFGERYGEIFITNKYGAVAGSTSKLTTFYHRNKNWWKQAYSNGKVFIDDRGFDNSVGSYVLGFVVPIWVDDEIAGILKCNISIERLFYKMPKFERTLGEGWSLIISRSKGRIIFKNNVEPLTESLPSVILDHMTEVNENYSSWLKIDGEESLIVHNFIDATFDNDIYNFGGTSESLDHKYGNSGEHWDLIAVITTSELYNEIIEVKRHVIVLVAILLFVCIVTAFMVSFKLTRNINSILPAIRNFGNGNLDTRINYASNDEVGLIASAIDTMAENLQATLVSKDELEKLVEEKKHLLRELNHRVKNNLALVSSLISLKQSSKYSEFHLNDIKLQIDAITLTHEMLAENEDIYKVDFSNYIDKILKNIISLSDINIKIKNDIEIGDLDFEIAKTLGLIINETATNTVKYAGALNDSIEYRVELTEDIFKGCYILIISNNGEPIAEHIEMNNPETLGLQLILALVKQLKGSVRLVRSPHPVFTIEFPKI